MKILSSAICAVPMAFFVTFATPTFASDGCSGSDAHAMIVGCTADIKSGSYPAISYNNRGAAYRELKMYPAAIKDYTQSIKLGDIGAYLGLGMTYNAMHKYDAAIATLTTALDIFEKGGDVGAFEPSIGYDQRAQAYEQKRLFDQAIADCTRAISNPTIFDDYGFNCRAWAYHLKGDDAGGLSDANAAVSKASTGFSGEDISDIKAEWSSHLASDEETRAEIYEKLGQRDNAIADYRAALNLVPNFKSAKAGLKRLGVKP